MSSLDVMGIGHAIVDVLGPCDDLFLQTHNIPKGGMALIGAQEAQRIHTAMTPEVSISGGSAANTMACLASLGAKAGFIGKVADDALGAVFRNDLTSIDVAFATRPLQTGVATGRCLVNITPDAERSMSTYIGAAAHLTTTDLDSALIAAAAVTYLEGYLYELPNSQQVFVAACKQAKAAGQRTALSLSDAGLVRRAGDSLARFIRDHVDILFANETEALALTQATHIDDALPDLLALAPCIAVTRSEKGAIIAGPDQAPTAIAASAPNGQVVDTTGAGDAFAGGFLYAFTRGHPLPDCARLGCFVAAHIISQIGARPQRHLHTLMASTFRQ